MKIAPSILSADFANLARDIRLVEQAGVEYLHIDAMDGWFVPNLTLGANVVKAIRPITDLVLDCHLMIEEPERYIEDFARSGADIISIHYEATQHIHRAIQQIKEHNVKAGVVINPGTPVEVLKPVLPYVDLVLVMSVNPGFGGQAFIQETLDKIKQLASWRKTKGYTYEIEVDGGINETTGPACLAAGCDVLVAGSYIYNAEDPVAAIKRLRG